MVKTICVLGRYRVIMDSQKNFRVASVENHSDGSPMYVSSDAHKYPVGAITQMTEMNSPGDDIGRSIIDRGVLVGAAAKALADMLRETEGL